MLGEKEETSKDTESAGALINGLSLESLAAQWKTKEEADKVKKTILKEEILTRIQKATCIITESASKAVDDYADNSSRIEKMDWDSLYELSANVMDEYTRHVDSILTHLDQLYQVCLLQRKH